jgi:uncharacterized membrane protein
MSIEMVSVVFDGAQTAEQELSDLRATRRDEWLTEVAVLERHMGGRFSMKATSPDYGDQDHVGAGIAIGGGTGLMLGMIAGPLGLIFWGTMGAVGGAAIGTSGEVGAFDPIVNEVKDSLPHNTSALILVAETVTAEKLATAVGNVGRQTLRRELTDEQLEQMTRTAVPA